MIRLPIDLIQAAIEQDSQISDIDLALLLESTIVEADKYRPVLVTFQSGEARRQLERVLDSEVIAKSVGGYIAGRGQYWLLVNSVQQDQVIAHIVKSIERYRHSIYYVHSKRYTHNHLGVILRLFACLHEERPVQGAESELTTALSWLNLVQLGGDDISQLLDLIGGPIWSDPVLRRTAEAVLSADLNLAQAARRLNTHRNTLSYRLRRIHVKTGVDLTNFHQAKCLFICMMRRMALE